LISDGLPDSKADKVDPLARLLGGSKRAASSAAKQTPRKVADRAKATADEKPAAKKNSFLQSLGIGQETFYEDE
jgi:hypothetical protein